MIIFIRSLIFQLFLYIWTFLVALVFLPLVPIRPGKLDIVGYVWSTGIIKALRAICNLRLEVRGMENIPSTACIIASKHLSALETLTFHYIFYQPVYILKQELTKLPLCGMYFIKMGMVIVDRKAGASALKKMLRDSIAKLQSGKNIIIFPEGTRTLIGQRLPYQTGIAALYSQANVPVVPTALNTGLFWSKKSFYIKPGTYIIEFLPPIYPGLNKTELMTTLEEKIETGSEKLILGANNAR